MNEIECGVCGRRFDPDEVMFTTCQECGMDICIYCVDTTTTSDVCDHCADAMSEATSGSRSEYEIAEEWVLQLREEKFTYEQMVKVFAIMRNRFRRQLEK